MSEKPKLALFAKVKNDMSLSPHMSANISKQSRSLISQLLSGVLPLEVEVGRYTQTCHELRNCKVCGKEVDDELHFLFRCEKLKLNREQYANKYPAVWVPDETKRLSLLLNKPYILSRLITEL